MHDPKFEKDVQQKMEELVFSPSEAVWQNVEKAVNGEKKRRLIPFWLFFLPALLVAGAGALYFSRSHRPGNATQASAAARPGASQPNAPASGTDQSAAQPGATRPEGARPNAAQPEAIRPDAARSAASQPGSARPEAVQPGMAGSGAAHPDVARADAVQPGSAKPEAIPPGVPGPSAPQAGATQPGLVQPDVARPAATQAGIAQSDAILPAASRPHTAKPGNGGVDPNANSAGTQPALHQTSSPYQTSSPRLSLIDRHSSAITATVLSAGKAPVAAKTRLPEPKRPWEAGFAGGIGVSSLNQGLLDKSTITSFDYRNYASAVTGVPHTYVSSTQPGLSYWAGILLQKGLRKDFTLSLGLNLHYYSSRIRTGGIVTASSATQTSATSSSFVLGTLAAAAQVYPYYSPGNSQSFTNRYYFLELPGSVSWQVGHSRKMPLFWEGGFSLSYLVSSNSLYYDPKSGVFYKDGSVVNRTQASVFTGLMVGLPLRGIRLQAGPQIQYGFTNLLNNEGAGGQHLLFGGIKLVFLPGKGKRAGAHVRGQ